MVQNIDTYKEYLSRLNKLDDYYNYLNNKNDSLKNIKLYYNTHIFISIVDFCEENYLLFTNVREFKKYLNNNPNKKKNKNIVKEDKTYRIFLR